MEHVVTAGDVLTFVLIAGGLLGLGVLALGLLVVLNPFRSGH